MPFDFQRGLVKITELDDERVLSGQFWGELRGFLAVAKTRSFNRAAEILGSSQPTVSRQVKRLQDLLGFQLLTATSQGVVLTDEGRRLAASASDLDERLYALSGGIKAKSRASSVSASRTPSPRLSLRQLSRGSRSAIRKFSFG